MEYSYIITHRENDLSRKKNLNSILEWVSSISTNIEVLLVEQDEAPKINKSKLPSTCKYIFIHNCGLFNRAWGLNVGFRYSKGNAVALADNDVLVDKDILFDCFTVCADNEYNYDAIKPFNRVIDLSKATTENYLNGELSLKSLTNTQEKQRTGISFCGGITFFKRKSFEFLGGFDERFIGWGGEDDAMSRFKIPLLKKVYVVEGTAYHLWHERANDESYRYSNYQNNLKLLEEYAQLDQQEVLKLCRRTRSSFGKVGTNDCL